jgi:hypothetical protein
MNFQSTDERKYEGMTDEEVLKEILIARGLQSMDSFNKLNNGTSLEVYNKFADLDPSKIFDENLLISSDGSEILFKVA